MALGERRSSASTSWPGSVYRSMRTRTTGGWVPEQVVSEPPELGWNGERCGHGGGTDLGARVILLLVLYWTSSSIERRTAVRVRGPTSTCAKSQPFVKCGRTVSVLGLVPSRREPDPTSRSGQPRSAHRWPCGRWPGCRRTQGARHGCYPVPGPSSCWLPADREDSTHLKHYLARRPRRVSVTTQRAHGCSWYPVGGASTAHQVWPARRSAMAVGLTPMRRISVRE